MLKIFSPSLWLVFSFSSKWSGSLSPITHCLGYLLLLFGHSKCPTLCDPMGCSTISQSLLKLMSTESVMPSHPLSSPCPPAFNLSQHQHLFQWVLFQSVLGIRWWKYWSFSFSINPSNEYSALISFRIDWFDLAVQGTLKSLLQHHSLKASILQSSAFFIVQLSHPYTATGKTIASTVWTFVD